MTEWSGSWLIIGFRFCNASFNCKDLTTGLLQFSSYLQLFFHAFFSSLLTFSVILLVHLDFLVYPSQPSIFSHLSFSSLHTFSFIHLIPPDFLVYPSHSVFSTFQISLNFSASGSSLFLTAPYKRPDSQQVSWRSKYGLHFTMAVRWYYMTWHYMHLAWHDIHLP